ncbi:MAG: hypothetical protein HA496_09950 [Thaumarchaeota archaeon]|nr:hypothetical protein [Nitrososphaerota archaeon]
MKVKTAFLDHVGKPTERFVETLFRSYYSSRLCVVKNILFNKGLYVVKTRIDCKQA